MSLAIVTPAPTLLLSSVARLKESLAITSTSEDAILLAKLRAASDAVSAFCRRVFARQAYTEVAGALGGIEFTCKEAPVVALGAVTFRGEVLTDVSVQDAQVGLLYRQLGFAWTAQRALGLGAMLRGLDWGTPLPHQEEPLWSVDYTAGYLLPEQNREGVATVSVQASDNSFNDSAGLFPALLKAGDVIETSGFTNAANNGRHLVTGTPTASKVMVSSTLVDEAAAANRNVLFQSLPYDVEQAVLETATTLYANRETDGNIVEKQAGLMRLRYSESGGGGVQDAAGLPPNAAARLRRHMR